MNGVLSAFLISFGVIFVAELGDKSQLMALTFATRYKTWPVLIGITIATSVVHLVSVAVGFGLGSALPTGWIALVAALAFFVFGAWTLRGDSLSEDEQQKAGKAARSALIAVTVAFFLAELGDKTMLATITLATQHGWFGVWLGSTLGMVAADALAIVIGRQLGKRLPERTIRYGASVGFVVFGVVLLFEALAELTGRSGWEVVSESLDHHTGAWIAAGLGVVAIAAVGFGRRWARDGARRSPMAGGLGSPSWWARILVGVALLLGLAAPILVAFDVIEPISVFSSPGWIVTGVGVLLLGLALVLASLVQMGSARRRHGRDLALTNSGLYAKVRNPAFTGMVIAMAGALVMAPTAIGVLATVLVVVAVQIQTRAVREPGLSQALGEEYALYVTRTGRFLPRLRTPHPEPTRERTEA
ncbi:TMEM165/GDT1 family protein [Pseudonocardia pini]|uniref:TMEM165/GDT1 family protein n=1 Tax=Pseudonocardia pini TaxID=2758030 RepID=UPI0015F0A847|nr:TMEM165/GDT1 family protein [Pseudonocardia pini]